MMKRFVTALCIIATLCLMLASCDKGFTLGPSESTPDYPAREEEKYAERIPGDDGTSKPSQSGGGSVSLRFHKEITVQTSQKTVELLFGNPSKSNKNAVIKIELNGATIASSGIIKPGYQVTKLDLAQGAENLLSTGNFEGKIIVEFYDPMTEEKGMVNTEIPVIATVK